MSKLNMVQSDKWPYAVTLVNTDKTFSISTQLAEFGSKDSIIEANARPANIVLFEYLKLLAAAPEMYELLANLAAVCDSWDDDYENDEQRANAFWHMARAAKGLLAKIEGGGE